MQSTNNKHVPASKSGTELDPLLRGAANFEKQRANRQTNKFPAKCPEERGSKKTKKRNELKQTLFSKEEGSFIESDQNSMGSTFIEVHRDQNH